MSEQEKHRYTVPLRTPDGLRLKLQEIIHVGGPHPYLWVGDKESCYAVLEIPEHLQRRARGLFRDLAEAVKP